MGFWPYGERLSVVTPLLAPEDKGRARERFDESAGLQYRNAGYHHPLRGLFASPAVCAERAALPPFPFPPSGAITP